MKGILAGVGNVSLFDQNTNALIVTSKTLTTSGISAEVNAEEARGGQGNLLLGKYFHDSAFKLDLTDQLWDLNYLALNMGGSITASSDIITQEQITVTEAGKITVTNKPVAFTTTSGVIGWFKPVSASSDDSYQIFSFDEKGVGTADVKKGDVLCVKYVISDSTARKFVVRANYIPSVVHAVLTLDVFKSGASEQTSGIGSSSKIGEVIVDVPNFQLEGAQDLSLTSSGIADISLSGSALATFDGEASCDNDGYYATITERKLNAGEWDNVAALAVADGNVEIAVNETSTLRIYKIFNNGTQPSLVDNSKLTFTSAAPATATVDETGTVKGIAQGITTVEIVAKGATLNTGAVIAVSAGA